MKVISFLLGNNVNKTINITNFESQNSLQELGVKLENPIDVKAILEGRHSLTVKDHESLYASGILSNGENYSIEHSIGDEMVLDGVPVEMKDVVFPHIFLSAYGDVIRMHVVEFVASAIRGA